MRRRPLLSTAPSMVHRKEPMTNWPIALFGEAMSPFTYVSVAPSVAPNRWCNNLAGPSWRTFGPCADGHVVSNMHKLQ